MLTLCIQSGGKSSRMGMDKALLDFDGQPLIQHLLTRLEGIASETLITTNHPDGYRFLGLPLVMDLIPERGALGGFYTALHAAAYPLVAVVACDMPFASSAVLRACKDQLVAEPHLDAVIPSTKQGLEPLHAVYRRETCLPAVKAVIDAGKWKVTSWHEAVNVRILPPKEIERLDPEGLAFENVNTPEQLKKAVQQVNQMKNT
jgi:molybdopterin-guanine dinucleotide biosynthesis protein A